MALLRGFCARAFLLTALFAGTCFAFFGFEKNRDSQSKLRVQTAKQAIDSSYGLPACTPGTPQFPNYIQPMKIDPTRMMGKWYFYMAWYDGISDTRPNVNIVITMTNLLSGSLTLYPGSNTQAIVLEQLYGSILRVANDQCSTVTPSYLSYLTVDGQQRGIGLFNGSAVWDTSLVLWTDYENYGVFFECDGYDINSGICAYPYPYVGTRVRPDKISAAMAGNIANTINQTMGPYCFTADLMKKYPWVNDLAECPATAPTDACYVSLKNAYLTLADPTFTG